MVKEPTDELELLRDLRRVAGEHALEELEGLPGGDEPVLARYRITGRIGEGGMGIVYEAEQENPRRRVALKVLRPGAASKPMLRRFEYEAEILGRLDHPGIAKVHEAGTWDTGRGPQPWFAMELVRGVTLAGYLAERNPDRAERLELFLAICEAVQHAHQKGVVHRDLKPANILVGDDGRPKVLDFGVARVSGEGAATMGTLAGQLVGTLPYMSPEQVGGDPEAVDIRSDVYALGVLLYELLSGRLPLDVSGLSITEAVLAITGNEPPPLGTLSSDLRGDLETIAAKALAKDRERRYDSAAALADDVARHLHHEPIAARPPSGIYQLKKFARRNRVLVGGVAAVIAALAIGVATTWRQAVRARKAETAMGDALEEAQTDARQARAAADFLRSVIEQADPANTDDEDPSVRDVLEEAARRAGVELGDEAVVEAQVRTSLGRAYHGLGDLAAATENLERALELSEATFGPDDDEVLDPLSSLVDVSFAAGEYDAMEEYAERLFALAGDRPEHRRQVAIAEHMIAQSLYVRARYDESEERHHAAIALLEETEDEASVELAQMKSGLGLVRQSTGDLESAEELMREAVEILRERLGSRNPTTANEIDLLAGILLRRRQLDEAEELAREALSIYRDRLGEDFGGSSTSLQTIGTAAFHRGDLATAEEHLSEAVRLRKLANGEEHPYTLQALLLLAQTQLQRGGLDDAEEGFRAILAAYEGSPDRDNPLVSGSLQLLATLLQTAGRNEEAEPLFRESLEMHLRLFEPDHPRVDYARKMFAAFYDAWGKPEEAARVRDD